MTYKSILGITALVLALAGYIPYFRDIFSGKTKPHIFSWLVWGTLTGIAFFGQLAGKGGAGTWVTGGTALACFAIALLAFHRGEKNITVSDWLSLLGAGCALGLWYLTREPLLAVALITLTDALGFWPTFRKSYTHPYQETLSTYGISSLKFIIALFALDTFSAVTALYPFSLVIMNGAFVVMLVVRRRRG